MKADTVIRHARRLRYACEQACDASQVGVARIGGPVIVSDLPAFTYWKIGSRSRPPAEDRRRSHDPLPVAAVADESTLAERLRSYAEQLETGREFGERLSFGESFERVEGDLRRAALICDPGRIVKAVVALAELRGWAMADPNLSARTWALRRIDRALEAFDLAGEVRAIAEDVKRQRAQDP